MSDQKSFTGVRRSRQTRLGVKIGDITARSLITAGGIGTIIAVIGVCVFLVWMVLPFMYSGSLGDNMAKEAPWKVEGNANTSILSVDKYRKLAWTIEGTSIIMRRVDTAEIVADIALPEGADPSVVAMGVDGESLVMSGPNGSVITGKIAFKPRVLNRTDAAAEVQNLEFGKLQAHEGSFYTVTPEDQLRQQTLVPEWEEPVVVADGGAKLKSLAFTKTSDGPLVVALLDDGRVRLVKMPKGEDESDDGLGWMFESEEKAEAEIIDMAITPNPELGSPRRVMVNTVGSWVLFVWDDGTTERYNIRRFPEGRKVEEFDLTPEEGAELTTMAWLLGGNTLLVGDDKGRVSAWFDTRQPGANTGDKLVMSRAHKFQTNLDSVKFLSPSPTKRMFVAADEKGRVEVHHTTSERLVAAANFGGPVSKVAMAPNDRGVLAVGNGQSTMWDLQADHPDVSLKVLFGRVWYEGGIRPEFKWQTSSGDEPKLSLTPLIFGTIKATLYSLLFGVPIALLAALYTSEFLHPSWKARIKPGIELMASLPSVVLGFLAGLVFAPFVDSFLGAMLGAVLIVPFTLLLGAYLWQLLPQRLAIKLSNARFLVMCLVIPLAVALSFVFGPPLVANLFFSGDIKGWLANPEFGSPLGGWMLLTFPVAVIAGFIISGRWISPMLSEMGRDKDRSTLALMDLVRFIALTVGVLILTWILAILVMNGCRLLDSMFGLGWGMDTRPDGDAFVPDPIFGGKMFFGPYDPRNSLVVGFGMGFAIIPIIYTIAEDALSTVPEHLRGASLGCGATPWQTATRVVIPTAMSGLFSAVMVGLGRAVGETMIVLMATGNTPIMDWNPFNGFQTLAAAIATEMPEATRDSTHYRVLFLAGLVLFALTFILNTIAESVRQRFRKKAVQL